MNREETTVTDMAPPTCEQLSKGTGFVQLQRSVDDSWRHGVRVSAVYRRESDGTFWRAQYNVSTDAETHGLRDDEATIVQVEPFQRTITDYQLVG